MLCPEPLENIAFLDTPIKEMAEWTKITLRIWKKIQSAFGLPGTLSPLASIGLMRTFTPNNMDSGFGRWSDCGLKYLYQLVKDGHLKTFTQLESEFNLPRTDFFRYLQLRSFMTTHKEWGKLIRPTSIEKFLIKQLSHEDRKIISKLYNIFLSTTKAHNSEHIRQRWEAETNREISVDTWKEICTEAHLATNSNTWREFKWKVITRFFRTPTITSKIGPAHCNSCWRNCGTENANHTHIFWLCPKLNPFWKDVFDALREVFKRNIPQTPIITLLGAIPEGLEGRDVKYLLNILLTAALKCITIRWLKPDPPTYNVWIQKIWDIYQMEQITYSLRLQKPIFIKRWKPVIALITQ